jgi:hypothetical protein
MMMSISLFYHISSCPPGENQMKNIISSIEPLSFPLKTLDPFLFCVYHTDNYPAGDIKMQAPIKGNGADFNPNADYRM